MQGVFQPLSSPIFVLVLIFRDYTMSSPKNKQKSKRKLVKGMGTVFGVTLTTSLFIVLSSFLILELANEYCFWTTSSSIWLLFSGHF